MRNMRVKELVFPMILTNHPGQDVSPTWKSYTDYKPTPSSSYLAAIRYALELYRVRKNYECVILGAWKTDFCFAMLQAILPFKRVPCILIDCIWYESKNKIKQNIKKFFLKLLDAGVDKYVVWARREIKEYSKTFGIKSDKFIFIPYHTTLDNYKLDVNEGDYVFSGGNFGRDYVTLIEAVRDIPVNVEIACTRPEIFEAMLIPKNVSIKGYTHEDFLKKMANCRINVVSLDTNLLHSGGQQTFLNSMFLGKPTIVNDPDGASDYIIHGEDGLLVPPKDPQALRDAIIMLLKNPNFAKKIGDRAKEKAKHYSTEDHFKKIISLADEIIKKREQSKDHLDTQ